MANPARATITDLGNLGVAVQRIANVASTKKQAALNAASDFLDGYISDQCELPLIAPYPQDVIDFECAIAAYRLLCNVGFNPMAPADKALKDERDDWIKWAERVSSGEVNPRWTDSSSGVDPSGVDVITATTRGYSERGLACPPGPFSDD